ncbi:MAG TPA: DUF4118 domain-containing protein [Bacteroidales bacterium]|nr:DUF4118 domain-containing protein [Bacteroidales bacterium]
MQDKVNYSPLKQYLTVISVISLTALVCSPLANQQGYHIVSFVLLFTISIMAVFLSIGPILLASSLSALLWNFFFIPPYFALHIEKTEDKLMFVSFFIIAMINGALTIRIRRQESLARDREERTNTIFELTRELSNANGIDEILDVACDDLKKYFNARSVFFIRERKNTPEIFERRLEEERLSEVNFEIARWVNRNSTVAGRFTEFYEDTTLTYYPLSGKSVNPGVVAIEFEKAMNDDLKAFWNGYLTQISNALEREHLGELALKARLLGESDKLYKTLFTSISHEFRIPIATIMGASDTLLLANSSDPDRDELLKEISIASTRLNHLVENLLNMSRLESGKISAKPDWCDLNDLINRVSKLLENELEQFKLEIVIPADFPLVRLDFGLMEQVFYNLFLNSSQYTAPGSIINMEACYNDGNLIITVKDNGPGFPVDVIDNAFNKFFKVDTKKAGGLGLGLSIVKGFTEAHNGRVKLENTIPSGAMFTITIPTEIADINLIKSDDE